MYRILYITPHLSTGGCPQYLTKKLQLLNNDNEVYCVEYNDYGEWFVVQKNQVISLLGPKYFALKDDKKEILSIIQKVDPDIIHMEEMPEYFMGDDVAGEIYKPIRRYNIVETSHDSSFNPSTKRHFPDQFIFVSEYQKRNVESLNVPSTVIEYPILFKSRLNREESLKSLDLDPNLFHIVNVGLFSPRKNQAEIIEYAKKMSHLPIQFHFVGNLAGNFQHYWEPLLKDTPSNCKIWGERSDVDTFFGCMDLFLFTSRGHTNDKETSPIVIREAISYNIPSLIYNLPVYLGMYDKYSNIEYLKNSIDENVNLISSYLNGVITKSLPDSSFCYIVSSYPYTDVMETTTVNCIRSLKNSSVLLTTHYKNHSLFENIASHVIYDDHNPIIKHTFYQHYWYDHPAYKVNLNLGSSGNDDYHGLAVWINYQNGVKKAKQLGYKYSVCLNYDLILSEQDLVVIENIIEDLEISFKKGYFIYEKAQEGDTLKTVFFVVNNDYFLEKFTPIRTPDEYHVDLQKNQSPSNGLENYVYNVLKNDLNDLIITNTNEHNLFPTSDVNLFSCSECACVLPVVGENKFIVWKSLESSIGNKNVVINVKENGKLIAKIKFNQSQKSFVYTVFDLKPNSTYTVIFDEYNVSLDKIYTKTFTFGSIEDLAKFGEYAVNDVLAMSDHKKDARINVHHFSSKETSVDSISSLPDIVYRQYLTGSDVELIPLLRYSSFETHIVVKDIEIKNSSEDFINFVKDARNYMYDNNLLIYSFGSCMDYTMFSVSKHYVGCKLENTNAYIINRDYLQQMSEIKVSNSMQLFNSYLLNVKKGFSALSNVVFL